MSLEIPNRSARRLGRAAPVLVATALAMVATLATASPARAGDAFRDGFEDELGRIAAHEVARVGRLLVHAPFVAAHAPHHPAPRFAHRHHRGHGRHAKHHRHARRHHGRAHPHRRHGSPCEIHHPVSARRHRW